MNMKVSRAAVDRAKKDGAEVRKKPATRKVADAPQNVALLQKDNSGELKRLRDEISELRGLLEESKKAAETQKLELVGMLSAVSEDKPFRIRPVRNMDPKDPEYLLVTHYDYVPVTYRKLDS